MLEMPGVRILLTEPVEIGPHPPGAQKEGPVELVFRGPAPLPVTEDLGPHGPDPLGVAEITTLPDVDVSTGHLQGGVWGHPIPRLRARPGRVHGDDLDDPADENGDGSGDGEHAALGFEHSSVEAGRSPSLSRDRVRRCVMVGLPYTAGAGAGRLFRDGRRRIP